MYKSAEVERLSDFLALVKKGSAWEIPTERLIRLNGNTRRGKYVNQSINDELKKYGLICNPAIENADYYGVVSISDPRDDLRERDTVTSLPLSAFPSEFGTLISCGLETPVKKIRTQMISLDISQIPVLSSNKRTAHGVVTWRSLAECSVDLSTAKASDAMSRPGRIASSADDFLELVDSIISQEYMLYSVPDGRIDGIVTASDLAKAFDGTARLYIKLQELESRLRTVLDRSPIPKLKQHLEPKRQSMKLFRGATDMMFGEYIEALKDPEVWAATGLRVDQELCLDLFQKAKDVRNGVMHFSSGSNDETDSEHSDEVAVIKALRILRSA
ncbi:CBS domain-containing protein [Amnibacterium kyonggiense]